LKTKPQAFTLVETVIALGIFAFAIVIMVGMLPVGLRSTRDVANESNAISVSSSILGAWRHAALNSTATLPNIVTNLSISAGNNRIFFNEFGTQTTPDQAAFRIDSQVSSDPSNPSLYRVDLICHWPANAPDTVAQKRVFTETFQK
jgi:uncharacterized protein (TIGR02598 family)